MLDQLPVGVVIAEAPSGRFTRINRYAAGLLGDSLVVEGLSAYDRLALRPPGGAPLAPEETPLGRAVHRGETVVDERFEIDPAGGDGPRFLSASSAPVRDDAGRVVAAVVVFEDVTERERAEQAGRDFVANASHELRTPLAAIGSAIEVLQAGAKEVPEERDLFLSHVEREVGRLARLARALLVLARAETRAQPPRQEVVPLRGLLRDVAAGLRPGPGVVVSVRCGTKLAALADRDVLEQIVVNLAANAARYTTSGRILLSGRATKHRAVIEVRDTGPGLSKEARDRIFDRFYRAGARDAEGFGLGLAIARQAAEALGAELELESEERRGTVARLRVPLATMATAVSYRIAVVDDEPAIRDAVSYALRSEGYDVEPYESGEQALRAVEQTPPPDLVVLDLMLPGLSGLEVCRRARADSDVPILLLTARDAEVDRVIGLEAGADDYVTKPFSMIELVSRVRAILRRRELDRNARRPVIRAGEIELDLTHHDVRVAGRQVRLTPSEFKVLALLAEQPERVFTRREIMQHLWDSDYVGDQRACDIHVSNIRRKIEANSETPERLLTVRGVGYKLTGV